MFALIDCDAIGLQGLLDFSQNTIIGNAIYIYIYIYIFIYRKLCLRLEFQHCVEDLESMQGE